MERLETGNIGIGNTSTLATLNNDRIAPMVGRGVPPSRPPRENSHPQLRRKMVYCTQPIKVPEQQTNRCSNG